MQRAISSSRAQAGMDLDVIGKFLDVYDVQIANTDALHLAAGCGHIDIVKFLLEVHDADIEQRDLDTMTPLLTAAEAAHWDIVRYLLDRGPTSQRPITTVRL